MGDASGVDPGRKGGPMRRVLIVAVLAVLCSLAFGASGTQAKFANCHNFACVNKKLNKLHKQEQQTAALVNNCERVAPVTVYGDPAGSFGYVFNNNDGTGTFFTSALDFTVTGDPISAFMIVDVCQGKAKAGGGFPLAPVPSGPPLSR
jgi:hypothetical protein